MEKQDNLEVNDIILLNDKEYCIIKVYGKYIVVLSNFKPLEILVGYMKDNGFIKETDRKIIEQVLLK